MDIKSKYLTILLTILCICLLMASCTRPYIAAAPKGFAVYPTSSEFKSISPDGVIYRVRHVNNKPYAELSYWQEAMKNRMIDAGYRFISDTTFEDNNLKKAYLELAAPVGDKDFIYLITITTHDEKIIIVEVTGEATLFNNRKEAILQAIADLKLK